MPLTNAQIAAHVRTFAQAIIKDELVKPADQPAIDALTEVATNLLQNINEIAAAAKAATNRGTPV